MAIKTYEFYACFKDIEIALNTNGNLNSENYKNIVN